MSPAELVKALLAGGGWVETRGGQSRLMGNIAEELKGELRAQREEFLEAWDAHQRDRYGKTPPLDQALLDQPPAWRADVYRRVEGYVRRQTDEVNQWVFARANAYQASRPDWGPEQITKAALRDVLYWQLGRFQKPEELLATFEWVQAGGRK